MHTYTEIHMDTHKDTTDKHSTHRCTHIYKCTLKATQRHAYIQTHTHRYTDTDTYWHMLTYIKTHMITHRDTQKNIEHTQMHTYIRHTDTQIHRHTPNT